MWPFGNNDRYVRSLLEENRALTGDIAHLEQELHCAQRQNSSGMFSGLGLGVLVGGLSEPLPDDETKKENDKLKATNKKLVSRIAYNESKED